MNNKKLNCHPEHVEGSQPLHISSRDVAEDTRLNYELDKWFWMPYRKGFALRGMTVLFLLACFPSVSQAEQCTPTPDCKSLGYTETSCPDGNGVKCPWNTSLLYCGENGKKICADMGHPYPCTGANEIPSGKVCANKYYTTCTCASGYEWKNGKCEKITCPVKSCAVGDVLYADKKCYICPANALPDQVPIGVVFTSGKAVGLVDLSTRASWNSAKSACSSYSIGGVSGWSWPSEDELLAMYNNINAIQTGLQSVVDGSKLAFTYYWSSSVYPYGSDTYYVVNPVSGATCYYYNGNYHVRPVLAF